tara:strand:+ start:215 stop:403 length:189 start_codon:yes stop_codon:yes gene_type:complete
LIREKTQKSGILQIITTFFDVFSSWFAFLFFLESSFHATCSGQMAFFENRMFENFEVALAMG